MLSARRRCRRRRLRCTCSSNPAGAKLPPKDPRDDIVTALLKADMDGDQLSELDFNVFFLLLAAARQRNDAQRRRRMDERAARLSRLIAMLAAESLAGPVGYRGNPAMGVAGDVLLPQRDERHEVRGQKIKAGDKVSIWYISANRDEEIFPDPFTTSISVSDTQPARSFRWRRPAFLRSRRQPRANGNEHPVRRTREARRVVERTGPAKTRRSNFIHSPHLPAPPDANSAQSRLRCRCRKKPSAPSLGHPRGLPFSSLRRPCGRLLA